MIDEDDIWDYDDYIDRPQKGEPLFIDNEERTLFDKDNEYAYMGYKRRSLYSFASAYKKAADRLVQSIKNNPIGFDDDLALPIVYLYRHYLELLLKSLVHEGNEVLGNPSDPVLNHEIDKLWQKLKPILIQGCKSDTLKVTEMEAVEEYIKEFAAIDNHSQAFRYPVDRKGKSLRDKPHLQNISYIDLQYLAKKMASIDLFLFESDMMLIKLPKLSEHNSTS